MQLLQNHNSKTKPEQLAHSPQPGPEEHREASSLLVAGWRWSVSLIPSISFFCKSAYTLETSKIISVFVIYQDSLDSSSFVAVQPGVHFVFLPSRHGESWSSGFVSGRSGDPLGQEWSNRWVARKPGNLPYAKWSSYIPL